MVTIEPEQGLLQAVKAIYKLVWARIIIKRQERKIRDLQVFSGELEKQLSDLKSKCNEMINDYDVLQGIGIDRREDGAWIINFSTLLHYMSNEDVEEVKEKMKWVK